MDGRSQRGAALEERQFLGNRGPVVEERRPGGPDLCLGRSRVGRRGRRGRGHRRGGRPAAGRGGRAASAAAATAAGGEEREQGQGSKNRNAASVKHASTVST